MWCVHRHRLHKSHTVTITNMEHEHKINWVWLSAPTTQSQNSELTYGGVSRLSVLTTTGGGLAWGERTHHRVRGHKNTTSTRVGHPPSELHPCWQHTLWGRAVHRADVKDTTDRLRTQQEAEISTQPYTVTFHTAEDAMLQHEAWINQTNEDADSAPSSSSFKLTLCLPHSLILCPSALLARSVSAREEPDGLLKVMWGKCGISPTGSISNLFTSSEPQLDGRHATKLNNEITSSQTNEEINERWMEQTERQENKNNK